MEIEKVLELPSDVQVMVVGDNASGKSTLMETLVRKNPSSVGYVRFQDCYGASDADYYLQLRWNRQAIDEDMPTASQFLDKAIENASFRDRWLPDGERAEMQSKRASMRKNLSALFGLDALKDRYVISLSSGESRKLQLSRALLAMPRTLVLDNPFIGLDAAARKQFSDFLGVLAANTGIRVIGVVPDLGVLPEYVTHLIYVNDGKASEPVPARGCKEIVPSIRIPRIDIPFKDYVPGGFYPLGGSPEIVRCNDVTIRYGEKTILKDFSWVVREGECWALNGPNGSGKSTLLSLVCADNPQSYACDIELFGHKRGGGESIWDIKKHIGYVSPELQRAYRHNIKAMDVVAGGLFDTLGLYNHPDGEQLETCMKWMYIIGIDYLADRPYLKLSGGEQRLCLIARAFVKDPELLILDEPFHGLDKKRSALVRGVIDRFAERPHKTVLMVSHFREDYPECINRELKLCSCCPEGHRLS